jgi:hypothetical protein
MTEFDDILATGTATQTQLGKLFRRNKSDMPRLLHGIAPSGRRKGFDVYDIAEAAQALVKPSDPAEVERAMLRMNKADMPPTLSNDFWAGQRSRIKFEQENGNLWHTDDVTAMASAMLHEVAMVLKLLVDNVERQAGLTNDQRRVIQRLADGAVNSAREALTERFSDWPMPADNVSVGTEEVL